MISYNPQLICISFFLSFFYLVIYFNDTSIQVVCEIELAERLKKETQLFILLIFFAIRNITYSSRKTFLVLILKRSATIKVMHNNGRIILYEQVGIPEMEK